MFYIGRDRRKIDHESDGRRQERTSLHLVFPGGQLTVISGSHLVWLLLGVVGTLAVVVYVLSRVS